MHRSYIEHAQFNTDSVAITDPHEIHHFKDVVRISIGDPITLFNGEGAEAEGRVLSVQKKRIEVKILSHKSAGTQKGLSGIILACAVPKKTKFEWIVEKATELGADDIIPLNTARTEFHMTQERSERKMSRYKTIAVNAAKQCRRPTLPTIHPVSPLESVLDLIDNNTTAIIPCVFSERIALHQALSKHKQGEKVLILIGPEGDFTEGEVARAVEHSAIPVSLGETVLKVETAAISTLAFTRLYLGNET